MLELEEIHHKPKSLRTFVAGEMVRAGPSHSRHTRGWAYLILDGKTARNLQGVRRLKLSHEQANMLHPWPPLDRLAWYIAQR